MNQPHAETTPTGLPIINCPQCLNKHPVGREHCLACGRASRFIDPDGMCPRCPLKGEKK